MIQLTENAQKEVRRLLADHNKPDAFLRAAVKAGGCSGFNYDAHFDDKITEHDRVFDNNGLKVVSDIKSLLYLDGMTIDYSGELVGGGFRFLNPKATGTCGCGTSFTV